MVVIVGDKDVAGAVNKHAAGVAQSSAGGWTTVAAEAIASIPGHGLNSSCRDDHFQDTPAFGNEDVSATVLGHATKSLNHRTGSHSHRPNDSPGTHHVPDPAG